MHNIYNMGHLKAILLQTSFPFLLSVPNIMLRLIDYVHSYGFYRFVASNVLLICFVPPSMTTWNCVYFWLVKIILLPEVDTIKRQSVKTANNCFWTISNRFVVLTIKGVSCVLPLLQGGFQFWKGVTLGWLSSVWYRSEVIYESPLSGNHRLSVS